MGVSIAVRIALNIPVTMFRIPVNALFQSPVNVPARKSMIPSKIGFKVPFHSLPIVWNTVSIKGSMIVLNTNSNAGITSFLSISPMALRAGFRCLSHVSLIPAAASLKNFMISGICR